MIRFKITLILAAIIICGASLLTGCKKENPVNNNPNNNQWGAETLTFKVNNSTDIIMKKVEGGDYSMEYMYEDQEATGFGTLLWDGDQKDRQTMATPTPSAM